MKATVYAQLPGDRIGHVIPPAYRELLPASLESQQEYSVLLFAHADRDVVHSAPVRRALRRLRTTAPGGLVVVGTVFTAEAQALLAEAGATVVARRKGRWTDESARARQL